MVIDNLRSLKTSSLGLMLIIAIGVWILPFLNAQQVLVSTPAPLYSLCLYWLKDQLVLSWLISLALILIEAFVLNKIVIEHQLLSKSTYIPGVLYVILISCVPEILPLHPILFCNLFFIITFNHLFSTYKKDNVSAICFNSGLMVGIASLFHYPVLFTFLIVLVALKQLRPFDWKEWASAILGLAVPYLFLFTYVYWNGAFAETLSGAPSFSFILSEIAFNFTYPVFFLLVMFLVLIIITLNPVIIEIKSSKVKVRKVFTLLIWFFLLTVLLMPGFSQFLLYNIAILSIPLSIYFATYFVNDEKPLLKEIIFILLICLLIYTQVVNLPNN